MAPRIDRRQERLDAATQRTRERTSAVSSAVRRSQNASGVRPYTAQEMYALPINQRSELHRSTEERVRRNNQRSRY